ncbi:D-arabinono-1,4-lactone oxidase [Arthrobacter sp. A5]|uniref:D-arabinono-1,4-lactone oxidase n=1 Tax=Arthrobacter sp. A5 TaxID=576926 RepID=UPI003DAA1B04
MDCPFRRFRCQENLADFGGRAHPGPRNSQDQTMFGGLFPEFKKFCSVRENADPLGVVGDAWVGRVRPAFQTGNSSCCVQAAWQRLNCRPCAQNSSRRK